MSTHTFDQYCELEEFEQRGTRIGAFSGRHEDERAQESPGYDWIDDSESRGIEQVDDLIHGSFEIEEIF